MTKPNAGPVKSIWSAIAAGCARASGQGAKRSAYTSGPASQALAARLSGLQPPRVVLQIDGPQQSMQAMGPGLEEEAARGRHQGDAQRFGCPAQSMGGRQEGPCHGGGQVKAVAVPLLQQVGTGGEDHHVAGKTRQCRRQIEAGVHVAMGEQTAQVTVTGGIFGQADGASAVLGVGDLGADDGDDPLATAGGHEGPQATQVVRVGQRQAVISQPPGVAAERLDRGGSPHQGVVGACGQGDHLLYPGQLVRMTISGIGDSCAFRVVIQCHYLKAIAGCGSGVSPFPHTALD
jgi:hypothetical protein